MLTKHIVGTLELASKYRYGLTSRGAPLYLFKPYDDTLPDYVVGSSERDTSQNQIALVEVSASSPAAPSASGSTDKAKAKGNLIRLFGPVGHYESEREALLKHYCPARAPKPPAILFADTTHDSKREYIGSETGWVTFHIDPLGCRDVDDAIAFHQETSTWAITIADATSFVAPDSEVCMAAEEIGASFYDLEGRVVRPMLPISISEGMASLLPSPSSDKKPKRGVTLFCGPEGQRRWALTWIDVTHSFTYESWTTSDLAWDLRISKDPHEWIEELMIRYNAAAATLFAANGVGILRSQSPADAEALTTWTAVSPELARLAHEAAQYEFVSVSSQGQSQSHAGLGGIAYCHATSPIRRYADLVNQRVLKALITQTPMPVLHETLVGHLNERTKANRRWSRDLTFLQHVKPGSVHLTEVLWISGTQVWVPKWSRLLRLRHEVSDPPAPGYRGAIQIFCDPTRRNWRQRILTASASASAPV